MEFINYTWRYEMYDKESIFAKPVVEKICKNVTKTFSKVMESLLLKVNVFMPRKTLCDIYTCFLIRGLIV